MPIDSTFMGDAHCRRWGHSRTEHSLVVHLLLPVHH